MMTLTEYAKRRGCSVKSVSVAASSGRLIDSVGRDARGRAVSIVDPELADREWERNTRRVTRGTSVTCDLPDATSAPASGKSPPAAAPAFNVSRDLRAAAAARREAAAADMAELELAARRGKLVDADQARADVINRYSLVKTRLLAVPTALGQRLPDLAARVVPVVDELLREALKELSADGRGHDA